MSKSAHALSLALSATTLLVAIGARAEPDRTFANPPSLELKFRAPPGAKPLRAGEAARPQAAPNEVSLKLDVVYTDGQIWNPAEGRYDKVRLRSYQGTRVDPNAPFVSPMLEITPGSTIRITLDNKLPPDDPSCKDPSVGVNTPHCFNSTNLHTHGLWVNPAGNSDNVLISINPGVNFQYEYNVPADHPAGTFWYHTHRHGSTALQVSSGMAGALIIRGNRMPTRTETGDLDTLLKLLKPTETPNFKTFKERVVVLQQIQYACRDAKYKKIKFKLDGKAYDCGTDDVGGIEGYDQFGPKTWRDSGRHTSINGVVLPTFNNARTGQVERWRVIHGGVRDTINLEFRKLKDGARSSQALRASEHDAYVAENCTGDPLPQHLVAADGLTLASVIKTTQTVYQPAYRWDTLMVFPQDGRYCVIDAAAPASASVGEAPPSRQLLGWVSVDKGRPVPADITAYLTGELVAAATANKYQPEVRDQVVADLRNGLKLSSFVPHPDVKDDEVRGTQELVFNIRTDLEPTEYQVDGKAYNSNDKGRVLMLGGVDEWTLTSKFASHPFHIHVNPFQVVRILDPSGKDVSVPDAVDIDKVNDTVDPQYRALKGVWKDTLWVKNLVPPDRPPPGGMYKVVIRTRYQRYIGDFVLHCHILDHEDQGMMQKVSVELPDGKGGVSHGHH